MVENPKPADSKEVDVHTMDYAQLGTLGTKGTESSPEGASVQKPLGERGVVFEAKGAIRGYNHEAAKLFPPV